MSGKIHDVAVIGGGIVGLATARELATSKTVVVLEAETYLAAHQTGHNSGVIHSGLYYKPGSLKAINCKNGRDAMYRYCAERDIPHDPCGKIVVATHKDELPPLDELERRGIRFVPLVEYFAERQERGPFHLLPRDPHCNATGYLMEAERLGEFLVDEDGLGISSRALPDSVRSAPADQPAPPAGRSASGAAG